MTTTSQDPDEIRREIDRTRERVTQDVDVLTESVRPSSIAHRTTQRAGARVSRVRDHVMGTAHDVASTGSDQVHGLADTAKDVPHAATRKARGNPLGAGAVALAAGWLIGSLLPASEKERQLASTAAEKAQPLVDEAKSVAAETASGLQEPAKQAAQSVTERAKQGVDTVREEGTTKAQEVKDQVSDGGSAGGSM